MNANVQVYARVWDKFTCSSRLFNLFRSEVIIRSYITIATGRKNPSLAGRLGDAIFMNSKQWLSDVRLGTVANSDVITKQAHLVGELVGDLVAVRDKFKVEVVQDGDDEELDVRMRETFGGAAAEGIDGVQ